MSKRIYFEDITTLALLYHYEATQGISRMLPKSLIEEYDKMIDKNLDEMNSTINVVYPLDYEKLIYRNTQDENGEWYSVLRFDLDIGEEKYRITHNSQKDLLAAAKMANALETIGIQLIDGKMKKIEHKNKTNLALDKIIERVIENPQDFYNKIAAILTPQEKEFLISQIKGKNCFNCANASCRVQFYEKTIETCCVAWNNQEMIGKQLLLVKE